MARTARTPNVMLRRFSAAVVSLVGGWFWRGVDLTPGWAALARLVGVAVAGDSRRMVASGNRIATPAEPRRCRTADADPVGALVLGTLVLDERPTVFQLAGCALILTGAYFATQRLPRTRRISS